MCSTPTARSNPAVPLIAQPLVAQPLEGVLDYPAFSVRLASPREIDETLPATLREMVREERGDSLRANVEAVRTVFAYGNATVGSCAQSACRGRAYEAILLALCWRALELRGQLKGGADSCLAQTATVPGSAAASRKRGSLRLPVWYPPALVEAIAMVQQRRRRAVRVGRRHVRAPSARLRNS
jgi:hypothetical protein